MGRPAPPSDDGSPARLIAAMVGIVGILLLGSLAWSAVGALVSAVGAASSALTSASPRPAPTLEAAAAVTPVTAPAAVTPATTPAALAVASTTAPTVAPAPATPTIAPVPTDTPEPSPTVEPTAVPTAIVAGRNPWILLPQPEPGAKVPQGSLTVEARGRGDSPITAMRLELDGAPLQTSVEQRSESIWRGSATTKVGPGEHTVRAVVTDADGRSGSFRWTFTAAPGP